MRPPLPLRKGVRRLHVAQGCGSGVAALEPRGWPGPAGSWRAGAQRQLHTLRARPELPGLIALAGTLNLANLAQNGWANTYYSAAVRSMGMSWRNFLFASFDPGGVMSVDKPPLALWVQVASVKLFGFHPLSILVPQALMGVASVVLVYDLTRRRFGRIAGSVAGLVLALTPISVAISRHNNPDALLVLCCVAALWFAVRALEDGRARWLVLSGMCIGLGFEAKMAVALMVVPGIVLAWLWVAPGGRRAALRAAALASGTMVACAGAWPALVALTPAGSRPWVSGTSDDSIFSLIFEYNGFGRLDGQAGGPAGAGSPAGLGGSGVFGGSTGPLRLLNESLGGQAGWLLGFAVVSAIALVLGTRLRRRDQRTGWLLALGGGFLTVAVAFSFAAGIFHPYYVSLLAPFTAALVGAGAAELLALAAARGQQGMALILARGLPVLAITAGVATELIVLHDNAGDLRWLAPALILSGALSCGPLILSTRARAPALATMLALLLIAPATWAVQTLGHPTNGTFPAGGPKGNAAGSPGRQGAGRVPAGALAALPRSAMPAPSGSGAADNPQGPAGLGPARQAAGELGSVAQGGAGFPGGAGGPGAGGPGAGGPGGGGEASLRAALSYVRSHGGGTIATASQSGAASEVILGADVAGIGGFSGRESEVGLAWFADEVRAGRIRWVLTGPSGPGPSVGGDRRVGATHVLDAVSEVCARVPDEAGQDASGAEGELLGLLGESGGSSAQGASATGGLYDCRGRSSLLENRETAASTPESSS